MRKSSNAQTPPRMPARNNGPATKRPSNCFIDHPALQGCQRREDCEKEHHEPMAPIPEGRGDLTCLCVEGLGRNATAAGVKLTEFAQ